MNMKKVEDALFRLASYPTEKDLKGMTTYGLPTIKLTKKALLYCILHLLKKQNETIERHRKDMDLLITIGKRS